MDTSSFSKPIHQKAKQSNHRSILIIDPASLPLSIMADQDSNKINPPLALSSSTTPWWDLHHHATRPVLSTSSRNNTGASFVSLREPHNNLNSSPCVHEDVSISASNHSTLTIDESSHRIIGTPSSNYIREPSTDNDSHIWSQLFRGVGGSQEMCRDEMGENLLNALSLKCFSGGLFEHSACDEYLRKLDSHHHDKWAEINGDEYLSSNTNEVFTNILNKQSFNTTASYNGDNNLIESNDHQRSLNILSSSNLVSCWSIAPPDQPRMIQHTVPHPCNNNIPSVNQYLHQPDITSDQTKHSLVYQPQLFDMGATPIFECENSGLNQTRQENDQCGESEQVGSAPATLFPMASFTNPNESRYRPNCANWRPREINMLSQHGYTPSVIDPYSNPCSMFSSKALPLDATKQPGTLGNLSMNKSNGRGQGAFINEGKKKRSNDDFQSSVTLKKPKRDSSDAKSSTAAKTTTIRTPKGKVEAEKLSSLQQIVSPYGKTDTASILQEAIGFIRRHQENVQLLSNPFLKPSVNKLQEAWGSLDRKGGINKVLDLKSKGLCLVPISSIPQDIKEDNSGLDYWPAYRGYLYR